GAVAAAPAPAGTPNFLGPKEKRWPPDGAPDGGTLTRGWASGDPKGWNPLLENAAELTELVEAYAAAPLADRNSFTDPDRWYGVLATHVAISDDHREFTITLRPGVKWHRPPGVDLDAPRYHWLRGEHLVTADDFVFTFGLIVNPQVENGFLKSYYADLESVRAESPTRLVVRWKKRLYASVDSTLSVAPLPKFLFGHEEDGAPIPEATLGLRFNQHWYNNKGYVGAGPYRMESYEPGRRVRLVRNDDFPGDRPAIREIVYPIYTDPSQTLLKLRAHELSAGGLTPGQYREQILDPKRTGAPTAGNPFLDGRLECRTLDQPAFRYLGWNADRPLFADARVRRAMTLAWNRKQIVENVFVGLGQVTTGPFLPGSPYNDPDIQPWPFDLAAARRLLEEAGYADTDGDGLLDRELRPGDGKRSPFAFSLLITSASKEIASAANVFKEDLLRIGVKLDVEAVEWSLMQKRMDEKSFDAYAGGWALSWETDLHQIWHSSQADAPRGSNRVGFRNKEADAVIEELRETFDRDRRVALFRRFHRIVHEQQPYSFFLVPRAPYCTWNDVLHVEFAKVRPVVNTLPWAMARATR
ncbi:MAG: hypothetical protein FJ104_05715, partial [Deltaproteobacteria bacterium]|nr:hypothetical protein [Deltaproteobacteria bacterium]